MSYPQLRCALAACDRRDSGLNLQQIENIHAAIAPLVVGEPGMSSYEKCVEFLKRPFRRFMGAKQEKRDDTMIRHARRAPLTPAESDFAAAARARLGMSSKP